MPAWCVGLSRRPASNTLETAKVDTVGDFYDFFTIVLNDPVGFRMVTMGRYAVRMQPKNYALPLMFLSLVTASVAHARGTIDKVEIKGLDKGDDAEMIENIEVSLSLYDTIGKPQGESRLEYLLSQAERQTREALEPFGYYNPVIKVDSPREGENLRVVIQVDKGPPTLVRREHIDITGPAQLDQIGRASCRERVF